MRPRYARSSSSSRATRRRHASVASAERSRFMCRSPKATSVPTYLLRSRSRSSRCQSPNTSCSRKSPPYSVSASSSSVVSPSFRSRASPTVASRSKRLASKSTATRESTAYWSFESVTQCAPPKVWRSRCSVTWKLLRTCSIDASGQNARSEEHTSELQSPCNLVCRLLLEKKKKKTANITIETHLHSYTHRKSDKQQLGGT